MYKYDTYDQAMVDARVAEFRDQTARRMAGDLTEDQFKPLRLKNGLYLQLHAYMLRVAVPYGTLSGAQMRMLGRIADKYDRGYGHFTTRQNIQYNWIKLAEAPDILADLATVEMHAIQTSGNCIRNISSDHYAGAAADELVDPRPYAELLRQWSSFHPEFDYLPRKFKIAVIASETDRAAMKLHDIGIRIVRSNRSAALREPLVLTADRRDLLGVHNQPQHRRDLGPVLGAGLVNHPQRVLHLEPGGLQALVEVALVAIDSAVYAQLLEDILLPHNHPTVALPGQQHLAQHEQHRRVKKSERRGAHGARHLEFGGAHVAHERELADPVEDQFEEQLVQARTNAHLIGQQRRPQRGGLHARQVGALDQLEQRPPRLLADHAGVAGPVGCSGGNIRVGVVATRLGAEIVGHSSLPVKR